MERFELVTDRNIYTIGESIHFMAMEVTSINKSETTFSSVLNAELISFDGTVLNQQKFPLINAVTNGVIHIPEGVQSGVYYLRIYTRFMRNFGPEHYTYVPITLLNYKTDEVLQRPLNYFADFYLDTLAKNEMQVNSIKLLSQSVLKRENQKLTISVPKKQKLLSEVVSVVPEFLYVPTQIKVVSKKLHKQVTYQFLPETRGISLSGLLIDNQSQLPVPYQGVNLSFIGTERFNLAVLSDSSGRFFFSFPPVKGKKELLITSPHKNNLSIKVDNDFCTEPVKLPYIPLMLGSDSNIPIVDLIKQSVINQQFISNKTDILNSVLPDDEVYYEEPSQSIVLSDYIPMPKLSDYFYELLTLAAVRKQNENYYLQVYGTASELRIFPPLVLIDNIIVTEIDKLLEVSPKRIERIEILNKPYIKGDLTYGGIVNIFSKEGDLAGMELPKSGLFFNYQLFSELQAFDYEQEIPENEPIMRNTLYWKVFDSDAENLSELTFKAGDLPGKYIVQLYGITPDGEVISDTASFMVK
ncbi:MAG: hypothetical protein AB7S69_13920 [Salinivirgaceae bacterium]